MIGLLSVPAGTPKSLTKTEERMVESLYQAFSRMSPLPDLDLYLETSHRGLLPVLRNGDPVLTRTLLGTDSAIEMSGEDFFRIHPISGIQMIGRLPEKSALRDFVKLLLTEMGQRIEAEGREELLLEEVAANWESLDALYEVSTEAFRSGNSREAVRRLVMRLAAFKPGLSAAVFLLADGQLAPFVSTTSEIQSMPLSELGLIRQVLEEKRALVLNASEPLEIGKSVGKGWQHATSLAAAPVTLRSDVVGCVLVWMEDPNSSFDTPFSRLVETVSQNASMLMESDSHERTVRDNERLAQDIEIASMIQQTMLGGDIPQDLPGLDFAAFSIPSQRIDGDFFEFYQLKDGSVEVLIGDVMGKGVAAALLGLAVKRAFSESLAVEAGGLTDRSVEPINIVQRSAQKVNKRLIDLERFVTLCFMRFNLPSSELQFVDCGHTRAIVHRKATGESFFISGDDMPFGVQIDQAFTQHSFQFLPGDTLLFYSDGVTENQNAEGEFFGEDLLIETVERWSSVGPEVLIEQIRKQASEFRGQKEFADDFTCIAVRVNLRENEPLQVLKAEFPCRLDQLSESRDWLHNAANSVPNGGLGPEGLMRLHLACGEAMNNCIIHGSPTPCSCSVSLEALIFEDSLTLNLRHKGPAFDPFNVPPPRFDGSSDGGFGLFIVARSSDQLAYQRGLDGTNQVSISILRKQEIH